MPGDALSDVAASVGLEEGRHGVEEILRCLSAREHAGTRSLSRLTGLPVPVVAAVCAELRRAGLLSPERPARLSPSGHELLERLGWAQTQAFACLACDGRGIAAPTELDAVAAELAAALRGAPRADPRLDQVHCTIESKLRRFAYLQQAGALGGKSVLLLGDDDFLSLTFSLAGRKLGTAPPRRLAVIDVDPAVVDFSRAALAGLGIEAELFGHDLRRPLPAELLRMFDTVFTDPPYTLGGVELFLSRAASALRPGVGGQTFLCMGGKPPGETVTLQRVITAMGFSIHRLLRNFNDYQGASVLGGSSHLYHLVAAAAVLPLVAGEFNAPIYSGEIRQPGRFYTCRACGARLAVGPRERWETIQVLRDQGCPRCRGTVFSPGRRVRGRSGR